MLPLLAWNPPTPGDAVIRDSKNPQGFRTYSVDNAVYATLFIWKSVPPPPLLGPPHLVIDQRVALPLIWTPYREEESGVPRPGYYVCVPARL